MSRLQKKESLKEARRRLIIDTAFRIFVEQKIEPVSMGEIASAAGIGRATLFRYYANKLELVVAVCAAKWKEYLDELDAKRPLSSIGDIPAIDRFTFTLDSYIDMYRYHKDLLQYNDNFNHYVTHEGVREEFFRVTVHTMMTACAYYAGGFIWGAENNKDYTPELLRIKEMILNYAKTLE